MNSTIELLNEVLKLHKAKTIAVSLGINESAISTWKKRKHLSAYYAAKMAAILGEDPNRAMALAAAEGESDPEKRAELIQCLWITPADVAIARLDEENNGGPPVSRTRHQRIMSPLL